MTTQITTGIIATDGVETADIKDANVTAAKLATNAVTTIKIADGAVTAAKLATAASGFPIAHIGGLKLSNDTDAAHDINILPGSARDSTNAVDIVLAAEITKRIDAAWAVGNDNGGLDGTESSGGTPDADTMYYVWLIKRSDTDVVDVCFSESATTPSRDATPIPTAYNYFRLIGALKTDGSANIITFTQVGDYFRYTGDVLLDLTDTGTSSTFETATLSAPPNSLVNVYMDYVGLDSGASTTNTVHVRAIGSADVAARPESVHHVGWGHDGGTDVTAVQAANTLEVLVDSSKQCQYAQSAGGTVKISTYAFTMLTRSNP